MEKDSGGGGIVSEIIGGVFTLLGTIFEAIAEFAPKIISFLLWCLLAILVLPCVFIAGNIYPLWVEWGEEL